MRSFTLPTLLALIPAIRLIAAEGITNGDVPTACQAVCRPLVQLSSVCQNNGGTADQIENCICKNTSFDVISLGSLCAICITQTNAVTDSMSSSFNPRQPGSEQNANVVTSQISNPSLPSAGSHKPHTTKHQQPHWQQPSLLQRQSLARIPLLPVLQPQPHLHRQWLRQAARAM
jgi:hypothetical protein